MKPYDLLVIKGGIYDPVLDRVKDLVLTQQQNDTLYVAIETLGGAPEIGFRIMRLLNAKYKKIYVVVPNQAMSTGTLMSLGADKIHMFHSSSLGPLDLQIEHPSDGSWISTLDVRDTMNTIISTSVVVSQKHYEQNYNKFGLSKTGAAKLANEEAVNLVRPIVDKIDPYHLHKSFRSAEVGAKYASILLSTRMMKANTELAQGVSSHLANNYETHNYAITLEEAQLLLRLTVADLNDLPEWEQIKPIYDGIQQGVQYECIAQVESPAEADAKGGKK
ncbi:hypothetical protein FBF31_02365 [Candidatus Saccharibacteria bacterium oral taxon 955]|nr:hypothetical protein FBF33_02355 [Candidatus Saccharibacteria bacterium oral taxon 955]QJU05910.1 hypothetical protein FBF31_02365 [Candidatus Saccharibacteria bacterium oral taxon 955]